MKPNSWDCFDTLIARNLVSPKSIFKIVGEKIGDSDFVNKRINAEKNSDGTYLGIYKNLPNIKKEIELEEEWKNCYPIVENMKKVKDGDYIVSDMYLPKSFIQELLKKCGLNKNVEIIVTKNGKFKGYVWDTLKDKINEHTGDNLFSDVKKSLQRNIRSSFFLEQELNCIEKTLFNQSNDLGGFSRKLRLMNENLEEKWIHSKGFFKKTYNLHWYEQINIDLNEKGPYIFHFEEVDRNKDYILLKRMYIKDNLYVKLYSDRCEKKSYSHQYEKIYSGNWINENKLNTYDHKTIWQEQANLNIPALILGANILNNLNKTNDYVFNYRDTFFLKKIYDKLFNTHTEYIDTSRILYYYPNKEFIEYLKIKTKNKTIVDMNGSGAASYECFKKNNLDYKLIYLYILGNPNIYEGKVSSIYRGKNCTIIEKFNLYNQGTLVDWKNGPVRSKLEYPLEIFNTQNKVVDLGCDEIPNFNLNIINHKLMEYPQEYLASSYTNSIVPIGNISKTILSHGRNIYKEEI